MLCPQCKQDIPDIIEYCPFCGTPARSRNNTAEKPPSDSLGYHTSPSTTEPEIAQNYKPDAALSDSETGSDTSCTNEPTESPQASYQPKVKKKLKNKGNLDKANASDSIKERRKEVLQDGFYDQIEPADQDEDASRSFNIIIKVLIFIIFLIILFLVLVYFLG